MPTTVSTLTKLMSQAEAGHGDRSVVRFAGPDGLRFKIYPVGSEQPWKQCRVGEAMDVIGTYRRKLGQWTDDEKLRLLLATNYFSFNPADSSQHFQVDIPADPAAPVVISHFYEWSGEPTEPEDAQRRVELSRAKWVAIAGATEAHFKTRLWRRSEAATEWQPGHNLLCREFGKELTLLAWAIEDADESQVETAIINWLGLEPAERWWLYTQTNAATGHWRLGRNKGWRKAVRYALTENPTGDR